jgi:hypothetical protein
MTENHTRASTTRNVESERQTSQCGLPPYTAAGEGEKRFVVQTPITFSLAGWHFILVFQASFSFQSKKGTKRRLGNELVFIVFELLVILQ